VAGVNPSPDAAHPVSFFSLSSETLPGMFLGAYCPQSGVPTPTTKQTPPVHLGPSSAVTPPTLFPLCSNPSGCCWSFEWTRRIQRAPPLRPFSWSLPPGPFPQIRGSSLFSMIAPYPRCSAHFRLFESPPKHLLVDASSTIRPFFSHPLPPYIRKVAESPSPPIVGHHHRLLL